MAHDLGAFRAKSSNPNNMKTRAEILKWLAVYIIAIGDGCPNGHLYAANMDKLDLEDHNMLLRALKESGLMTESNYYLTLTPKGSIMWSKLAKEVLTKEP